MREEFGTQLENGALQFVRDLPGPIDRVWRFMVDPEKRALWFAGGTTGDKVGDEFVWDFDHGKISDEPLPDKWSDLAGGMQARGRIVAIEPPRLLEVFSFEDSLTTRFELSEVGDRVRLVLTQQPPTNYEDLVSTAAGWQACLGVLLDRLSDRKPRGFWTEHESASELYRERLQLPS